MSCMLNIMMLEAQKNMQKLNAHGE